MIRRYPLAAFFVLASAISWAMWAPFALSAGETRPEASISWLLGGFGPLAAALLVTLSLEGTTGAKRFIGRIFAWRHRARWYLFALLLPIAVYLVAFLAYVALRGMPDGFSAPPLYLYPLALLFGSVLGGGQEEPGWRGFALPRLLAANTPFVSSIVIGVFWALWHAPLFLAPNAPQSDMPFGWYFLNTLALSIVFTWFFEKTGGSILLAILLHGGVNAPSGWVPPELFHSYAFFTAATWLIAVALIVNYGPARFFRKG